LEAPIIAHESGVELQTAESLALLGEKIRNLRGHGLQEGVSTRLLVYAGRLVAQGIEPRRAAQVSVVWGLTDDADIQRSVAEVVASIFP
jgi:nitric oxide reductase NorQ protein